jgi:hypothetical protein
VFIDNGWRSLWEGGIRPFASHCVGTPGTSKTKCIRPYDESTGERMEADASSHVSRRGRCHRAPSPGVSAIEQPSDREPRSHRDGPLPHGPRRATCVPGVRPVPAPQRRERGHQGTLGYRPALTQGRALHASGPASRPVRRRGEAAERRAANSGRRFQRLRARPRDPKKRPLRGSRPSIPDRRLHSSETEPSTRISAPKPTTSIWTAGQGDRTSAASSSTPRASATPSSASTARASA